MPGNRSRSSIPPIWPLSPSATGVPQGSADSGGRCGRGRPYGRDDRPDAANAAFTVIVPALVLLAGYRLSGLLFVRIDARVENALLALDRCGSARQASCGRMRRRLESCASTWKRAISSLCGDPAGALALVVTDHTSMLTEYWSVVLAAEFICYGMLPWIQTRPPMIRRGHGEVGGLGEVGVVVESTDCAARQHSRQHHPERTRRRRNGHCARRHVRQPGTRHAIPRPRL
jgi:hypothetical protein